MVHIMLRLDVIVFLKLFDEQCYYSVGLYECEDAMYGAWSKNDHALRG